MSKDRLHSWSGASSPNHDGENYSPVLPSFDGLCIAGPEIVRGEDGTIIGHDSHSSHEDPKDAREEVEAMLARFATTSKKA